MGNRVFFAKKKKMTNTWVFKWHKFMCVLVNKVREFFHQRKVIKITKKVLRDYDEAWKKLAKL